MAKVTALPRSDQFSNIHRDVLDAEPDTDEEIASLLGELRTRGNNAFNHQRLREADALYSKGLEVADRTSDVAQTFFSNRSATRLGMGKSEKALDDAVAAIGISPDWAKGFFRKGQALEALGRYDEAIGAFEEVVKFEPDNNAVLTKLIKVKASAKEGVCKGSSRPAHRTPSL